ncbi:YhgE/Pip domain-containing protein, partial [Microbacterium sp.]|uniref:YhgE/Pip domain-containing protein n=1 Tax=Microbacterium sp. TaxID=51671 RepID=UPI003A897E9D
MKPLVPNRPSWVTVLVLLLVPTLLAGGFLWGTWRSDKRLREVQAAVVNNDEMVTIDGQAMPLGRQLAAEIVDTQRSQNLTWVLADADKADTGLKDGTYAAVVTIPKNFSAAATSFAKPVDEAEQATIQVETSKIVGISETALGQSITYAAVNSLNEFLTQEYLKNVYLAFNDQAVDMLDLVDGTQELADGAGQLADGTSASADGARQLADGLHQASDGSGPLRSGAAASASGAADLSAGASALADGAVSWVSGAQTYATGVDTFAEGLDTYADGAQQFAGGAHIYADGVGHYADGINSSLTPVLHAIEVLPEWGDWTAGIGSVIGDSPDIPALVGQAGLAVDGVRTFIQTVQSIQPAAHATATAVQTAAVQSGTFGASDVNPAATCPAPYDADPALCQAYKAGASDAGDAISGTLTTEVVTAAMTVDGTLTALNAGAPELVGMLDVLTANLDQLAAWAPQLQEAYDILSAEM